MSCIQSYIIVVPQAPGIARTTLQDNHQVTPIISYCIVSLINYVVLLLYYKKQKVIDNKMLNFLNKQYAAINSCL